MRFSSCTQAGLVDVAAKPGLVTFNGHDLLPHEAALLGDALVACGERAEKLGDLCTRAERISREIKALDPFSALEG